MSQFSSTGQCSCGNSQFDIQSQPLLRFICHCTICQDFHQAAYADMVLHLSKSVTVTTPDEINYRCYSFPPIVHRGTCKSCQKPTIEYLKTKVIPDFAIIPAANYTAKEKLPEPSFHVFYHRRRQDMNDDCPKISGYLRSQLAVTKHILGGIFS